MNWEIWIDTYIHTIGFFVFFYCLLVFLFLFLMWTILYFIEFVTMLLLFYVLVFLAERHVGFELPDGMHTPCMGRQKS